MPCSSHFRVTGGKSETDFLFAADALSETIKFLVEDHRVIARDIHDDFVNAFEIRVLECVEKSDAVDFDRPRESDFASRNGLARQRA